MITPKVTANKIVTHKIAKPIVKGWIKNGNNKINKRIKVEVKTWIRI